jgi:hypothetical protein
VRREVPLGSKNQKNCKNIFIFIKNVFTMQRVFWEFFCCQNPNFLEFSQGEAWDLGMLIMRQISQISGIWQMCIVIEGIQ